MLISSKDNKSIKRLSKLLSSRKERNESGEFVIEGMRNCTDAAMEAVNGGKLIITELYYTKQALEKYSQLLSTEYFDKLSDCEKYEITPELAERISDSESSQGVFVVAKKLDKIFDADKINVNGKYVLLNCIQDPGNLGTILRTADAMGASGVVLSNNCCDLYNPKVVRSAMGSLARVEVFVEQSFEKVVDTFRKLGVETCATVIEGGENITGVSFDKPVAVCIGNEGRGMSEEHVALCDRKLTISMQGNINSLNAATAATIVMWEMFR